MNLQSKACRKRILCPNCENCKIILDNRTFVLYYVREEQKFGRSVRRKEGTRMQKESELDFSPLPDETAMAQLAYDDWERAEAETMAEYISRRRTVDLASLVRQVVDEELTDTRGVCALAKPPPYIRSNAPRNASGGTSNTSCSTSTICCTFRFCRWPCARRWSSPPHGTERRTPHGGCGSCAQANICRRIKSAPPSESRKNGCARSRTDRTFRTRRSCCVWRRFTACAPIRS